MNSSYSLSQALQQQSSVEESSSTVATSLASPSSGRPSILKGLVQQAQQALEESSQEAMLATGGEASPLAVAQQAALKARDAVSNLQVPVPPGPEDLTATASSLGAGEAQQAVFRGLHVQEA